MLNRNRDWKSSGPWATRPNDLEVRQHLVNIMKAAAEIGIMIFAQRSSFEYHWAVPNERLMLILPLRS